MSGSVRPWVEVTGAVALLAGLALVGMQIAQSNEITRIQLATSVSQSWRAVDATRQGEEFAKVLAKSIQNPSELTLAEFLELDAYYLGVLDQLNSVATQIETGYRENTLATGVQTNARIYFSNPFAKAWLEAHVEGIPRETWVTMLLAAAEGVDSGALESRFERVIDRAANYDLPAETLAE